MKKNFSLILAAVITAATLASCAAGTGSTESTGPVETTGDSKLPTYAGQTISDYDSEGKFILVSSENRAVYTQEYGYVVFTYAGEAVQKIQQVIAFDDEETATKYVNDIAIEAVNKGEVPPTMRASGRYVIVPVAFSNNSKDLGYYYTQTKTKVTADFSKTEEGDEH